MQAIRAKINTKINNGLSYFSAKTSLPKEVTQYTDVGRTGTKIRLIDSALTFVKGSLQPIATALLNPVVLKTVGLGAAAVSGTALTGGTLGVAILIIVVIAVQIQKRRVGLRNLEKLLNIIQVICTQLFITNSIINELSRYFNVPLNETIQKEIETRIDSLSKYVFGLFDQTEEATTRLGWVAKKMGSSFKYSYRWLNQNRINTEIVNNLTIINSLYDALFSQLEFELDEMEFKCRDNNSESDCEFICTKYKMADSGNIIYIFDSSKKEDENKNTILSKYENLGVDKKTNYEEAYIYWTQNSNLYQLLKSKKTQRDEFFTSVIKTLTAQKDIVKEIDAIAADPSKVSAEEVIKSDDAATNIKIIDDTKVEILSDIKPPHEEKEPQPGGGRTSTKKSIMYQMKQLFKTNKMLINKCKKCKNTYRKRKYRRFTKKR